jgi:hypothetical protein
MAMVSEHSLLTAYAALHKAAHRVVSRHDLGLLAKRGDSECIEALRAALGVSWADGDGDAVDSVAMAGSVETATRLGFSLLKEEFVRDEEDGALDRLLMRVYLMGVREGNRLTAAIEEPQPPSDAIHNEQSGNPGDAR